MMAISSKSSTLAIYSNMVMSKRGQEVIILDSLPQLKIKS